MCIALLLLAVFANAETVARPPITGIAHVSLYVHDLGASMPFYKQMLGFEEPYSLKNKDGSPSMAFLKANDRQYIELAPEKVSGSSRLSHYALEVPDAEAMRQYLKSRGVTVPDHVPTGRIGNLNFMIKDPQGVSIEIVQYGPNSWTRQANGKFMSDRRVSKHMMHVGFVVTDLKAELDFYTGVLGFREFWRGSKDGTTLSWINLKLPDSDDYVEFMLYTKPPSGPALGTAEHLCLEVGDANAAAELLKQRAETIGYRRSIEVRIGKNGKRQINLYDPDGTRTELMEPKTVTGQAVPSSTAPPPE